MNRARLFESSKQIEVHEMVSMVPVWCALAMLMSIVPMRSTNAQTSIDDDSMETDDSVEPRVLFEGEVELAAAQDGNLNLDTEDEEDATELEAGLELSITYRHSQQLLAYSNLTLSRELNIENQDDVREYQSTFEVDEAYIEMTDLFEIEDVLENTSLRAGRQSISDSREWLYDESVDGLLFEAKLDSLDTKIGLSLNREEVFGSNLLGHTDKDQINNLMVFSEHEPFKDLDLRIGAYGIVRDDRSADNDSPRFLALRALGSVLDEHLDYWADISWVRGDDDDKAIKGHGLDVGSTASFGPDGSVYVTVAYAFGSGNGDTDTDFRQTGLHGNTDKFGGVSRFNYYGELLDPELSNLHIMTVGVGFKYGDMNSVDFIYHWYRQDRTLDELRNSDLDEDPNGVNKQLGDELDMVWGMNHGPELESEISLGYFRPGHAFGEFVDDAYIARAKLTFSF